MNFNFIFIMHTLYIHRSVIKWSKWLGTPSGHRNLDITPRHIPSNIKGKNSSNLGEYTTEKTTACKLGCTTQGWIRSANSKPQEHIGYDYYRVGIKALFWNQRDFLALKVSVYLLLL